jgi:hypothetical protein
MRKSISGRTSPHGSCTTARAMKSATALDGDHATRCNLAIVDNDEGTGEPVDPDPVVPTVGAN